MDDIATSPTHDDNPNSDYTKRQKKILEEAQRLLEIMDDFIICMCDDDY